MSICGQKLAGNKLYTWGVMKWSLGDFFWGDGVFVFEISFDVAAVALTVKQTELFADADATR